jgi:hypothetical protein
MVVVPETTIRVATLNVAGLPNALPPIEQRAVELCRRFEDSDLQVINLQEVWWGRYLKLFRRLLPSYPHVAWRRGLAGQPCGGLATFSRLPLGPVRFVSFRASRPDAGSLRFRADLQVRSLLQGVLTVELPSVGVVLGNTHLVANHDGDWSPENRHYGYQRAQIAILHEALTWARAKARTRADCTVVTGDLNVAADGPLYSAIVPGEAWLDPFAASDPVTFRSEYLPAGASGHRIDYLLVRGDSRRPQVVEPELLFGDPAELADGRSGHLSDHFGLAARIVLG